MGIVVPADGSHGPWGSGSWPIRLVRAVYAARPGESAELLSTGHCFRPDDNFAVHVQTLTRVTRVLVVNTALFGVLESLS